MSDQIYLSGERATMTHDEYENIWNRIGIGDYSDLPSIFCIAPPKPIQEMNAEEKLRHKALLEQAIRILRINVSFMITDIKSFAEGVSEAERVAMFEYEKKLAPKARAVIADRAKKVSAREKMIDAIQREKGWDRIKAEKFVALMADDEDNDDAAEVVATAEQVAKADGRAATSNVEDVVNLETECCGKPTKRSSVVIGSRTIYTAKCVGDCGMLYREKKAVNA